MGIMLFRQGGKRLLVYERGISDSKVNIPWGQIASYTFTLQRVIHAGVHTESVVAYAFIPTFPAGRLQFRFSFLEKRNLDPAFEIAHIHITAALADRMMAELRAGRSVAWTKRLTLRPEGLEHPGHSGGIRIARYADIAEPVTESLLVISKVRLIERHTESVLTTLTPDEPNFFPGMLVLEKMRLQQTPFDVGLAY